MNELARRELLFSTALLALLVGVFYLFYRIMAPFLVPLAWGAVLVIGLHPAHAWVARRLRRRGLSALVSTAAVALLILAPLAYLVGALVSEAAGLYSRLQVGWGSQIVSDVASRVDPILRGVAARLQGVIDLSRWNFQDALLGLLRTVSTFVVNNTAAAIANVTRVLLQFLLTLLSMYYLFKDGHSLVDRIAGLIPLPQAHARAMLAHVGAVVRATLYGGLVVAGIQGALGGLLFWILGIPSALFWGVVMAFLSLLPLIGAFVVYVPAGIILLISGAYVKALILLGFGVVVVSQVDNFLRPLLVSGRTEMHPLLLFFSMGGGATVFGLLGLVLGPVIAALFIAALDIYRMSIHPASEVVQPPAHDIAAP